jgi:hypothetical protein
MACSSTDPRERWIDHAEQSLFALASELRRVPLDASTKHTHVRALELKRDVVRWRESLPDDDVVSAALEEIEELRRGLQGHPTMADRSRSAALATARATLSSRRAPMCRRTRCTTSRGP